ncbi:MAG: DMT family transporter [Rhodospirillales bacterium]|jgi:drug/metabolite transporter (DMT)-like permease|nr:DMT family transporter [Rhodospirillales bacterium]
MTNALLYAATVLFWGTSWLAIKFQLGIVAPEVSIVYRFAASALVMLAVCLVTRRRLRFSWREHVFMAAQGLCLFSTNYLLLYQATRFLTSGLVAVAFSTITVITIALGALFFGFPVRPRVAAAAACGLVGIGLVFWPEIRAFDLAAGGSLGLALALGGTASAATGMLMSARNQRAGLPVIPNNAWSMAYGFLFITLYAGARGLPFTFDPSPAYVISLLYLAVGATVIGFWTYLTLVGRIGPDRAAYASVLFPIVALTLSTLFEGFAWTPLALGGVVLVLAGNALVLIARSRA